MTVHPIGQAILASDLCSCGQPIAQHKCPSSSGAAPRQPKTASCRACGEKAHQNLEKTTVALECLYRQWAKATGQLQVTASNRLVMPDVTENNIRRLHVWLAGNAGTPTPTTMQPDGTFQQPDTAAVLKRMQARAADAPAQPDDQEQPFQQDVADIVAAHNMTAEEAYMHPTNCDDGCTDVSYTPGYNPCRAADNAAEALRDSSLPPEPDIALDTPLVAATAYHVDDDISDLF